LETDDPELLEDELEDEFDEDCFLKLLLELFLCKLSPEEDELELLDDFLRWCFFFCFLERLSFFCFC